MLTVSACAIEMNVRLPLMLGLARSGENVHAHSLPASRLCVNNSRTAISQKWDRDLPLLGPRVMARLARKCVCVVVKRRRYASVYFRCITDLYPGLLPFYFPKPRDLDRGFYFPE